MKKTTLLTGIFVVTLGISAQAQTIADWTFETSQPATAGPVVPEVGLGSANGSHAGAAVYSSPSGNGSAHSYSANTWAVNDYWQYTVSTVGDTDVTLSYDQTGSSTGPKTFQLEYSTDGTTFNNVNSAYNVALSTWNPTTYMPAFTTSFDLSAATSDAVDNQAALILRFVDTSTTSIGNGTVASGGTDRMDNVLLAEVPEPSTLALVGMGGSVCLGFFRRFKK